ncbi:MAG: SGNH/GDSL hydrolase family protein [Verrucomicrobiae bacterium]|nr:SGNH/GDSL hydrolase family protein [Verrucomicrobiae bacterium]
MATDPTVPPVFTGRVARESNPGRPPQFAFSRFSQAARRLIVAGGIAALFGIGASAQEDAKDEAFTFRQGERVVLIGSTLADRLQHFGWLELRLQLAHPDLHLSLRNMGWSGDEVALMPRPLDFGDLETHLTDQKADTILMCFGTNESFAGEAGLEKFRTDLRTLIERLSAVSFNGESPARLVLVSPIAQEQLVAPWPDAAPRNLALEKYTAAMGEEAKAAGIRFIDLFHPTRSLMAENSGAPLTINGLHPTSDGYRAISEILALGLGVSDPLPRDEAAVQGLRDLIIEKNREFMLRWRPVNAEYVFGRRKEPFGVLTFPPEMEQLDRQLTALDEKIQAEAGKVAASKP